MEYNLKYKVKATGKIIKGRRPEGTRRLEMENGETMAKSTASINLAFLGRYEKNGNFVPYERPQRVSFTTPNGFKIVSQVSF